MFVSTREAVLMANKTSLCHVRKTATCTFGTQEPLQSRSCRSILSVSSGFHLFLLTCTSRTDQAKLVFLRSSSILTRTTRISTLHLMKATWCWSTGQSSQLVKTQRLQKMLDWLVNLSATTDPHLHLRDRHSTMIWSWQSTTSTLRSGRFQLKPKSYQSTDLLTLRDRTTLAVRLVLRDQAWSSSQRQMELMCGTSWTSQTSRALQSTLRQVQSLISGSKSSKTESKSEQSSSWLTATKLKALFTCMKCLLTWAQSKKTKREAFRSSGTLKSENATMWPNVESRWKLTLTSSKSPNK
jgi:hypothetical protein